MSKGNYSTPTSLQFLYAIFQCCELKEVNSSSQQPSRSDVMIIRPSCHHTPYLRDNQPCIGWSWRDNITNQCQPMLLNIGCVRRRMYNKYHVLKYTRKIEASFFNIYTSKRELHFNYYDAFLSATVSPSGRPISFSTNYIRYSSRKRWVTTLLSVADRLWRDHDVTRWRRWRKM